jgi:hypothetical protein
MSQLSALAENLQSDVLSKNLEETELKTGLIKFIKNYPTATADEDCRFFLSELSRLIDTFHKFSRRSEQGLNDLVNALVSLHARRVLDRDLVLMLFRSTPPESILSHFRQTAADGCKHAEVALEITQAKAESDYFKLAEYIPDNWLTLYKDDFDKFLIQHRSAMLECMSEKMLGLPYGDDLKDQLYKKLSSVFHLPVNELIKTNDELIFKSAKMFFFFSLYGEVLEKDEKGEYIMPSPFLAKFLGISHEQVNEEIKDSIPPENIIPQSLAELSPNDPIN